MRLRKILRSTVPQALIGVAVGILFRTSLDPQTPRDAAYYLQCAVHGGIIGGGIGLTNLAFQAYAMPRLKRAPLLAEILLWSLAILIGIGVLFYAATYLVYGAGPARGLLPILPWETSLSTTVLAEMTTSPTPATATINPSAFRTSIAWSLHSNKLPLRYSKRRA